MPIRPAMTAFDPHQALADVEHANTPEQRRYFRVAGVTIALDCALDVNTVAFKRSLAPFAAEGPGDDTAVFRHHFEWPRIPRQTDWGAVQYNRPPWIVSKKDETWIYRCYGTGQNRCSKLAVFNEAHTRAALFSRPRELAWLRAGEWSSLSLMPTDQIWLCRLMADRNAAALHSAAAIVNGRALVFAGHSNAGKSTITTMLKSSTRFRHVEILCDDRNIVRNHDGTWLTHGTWCHGTVKDVSASSAPLAAILFLEKSDRNTLIPVTNRTVATRKLLATLIRPMTTADWWEKELDVLSRLIAETPCYIMRFDRSGDILSKLESLTP